MSNPHLRRVGVIDELGEFVKAPPRKSWLSEREDKSQQTFWNQHQHDTVLYVIISDESSRTPDRRE